MRVQQAEFHAHAGRSRAWRQRSRPPHGPSRRPVKIGVLATLEGPFAAGGADGMRGAELAIRERGGTVAGRKIEMIKASSDAKPDVAVNSARKLVEQDKVDILVGPLSGGEGIAVKDYSKTQPQVTFINGSSGAQATTLTNPSPNFFRFNTDGGQWMVGLGKEAMKRGYKKRDGDRRGLLVPVFAGPGLHDRVLRAPAARFRSRPGCRSAARTIRRSSRASRRTSTRSWSCLAVPMRSTS